ncbi:MAG TPA: hypothetical protein VN441_10730, partial [Syntrophomonas sp.]|nr:hypothetical protein [Syntrophomonas sp.]
HYKRKGQMANKRKQNLQTGEVWTEEELADYLGFQFIAGFTKGGAPFGIGISGDETDSTNEILDTDENLPF